MLLILDLDDTIFPTKSINSSTFTPVLDVVEKYALPIFGATKTETIIEALWHRPFDVVAQQYHFSEDFVQHFYREIDRIDFQLNISTYPDYPILKALSFDKILVTTGFQKLQVAKVKALGIENDFKEFIIDNPTDPNRIYKKGIFNQIQEQHSIAPEDIWVIGDNPTSEIKAGNELGMTTVQRIHETKNTPQVANHQIKSFSELVALLPES